MWADMLPGRCASLNMSKNNPPACPIAKPRGLAAVLQWDKYYTTHYRETPGLGTCLDPEVKPPIFTLLALCWELSTYFLAVAKPAGCRGGRSPQKPGKCSLGRAGHGEALWETSLASAAARMGQRWAKPAKAWLRAEGWVQAFPFPSKVFVFIFSAQRAALPWQVIFCLLPTLYGCSGCKLTKS